jgi:hypothetical protein
MPVEETENEIRVRQFDPGECVDGGLDNGETAAYKDMDTGVRAVVCKRKDSDSVEVQSLRFDKDKFTKEEAVAWAKEHDFTASVRDELMQRRHGIEQTVTVRMHAHGFEETPGQPQDADKPKLSEGMEDFKTRCNRALDQMGWTIYGSPNPPYDFVIVELYTDAMIVQNVFDGLFYRIPVTVGESGEVTLGTPEPYDVTFTPDDHAPAGAEPPAAAPLDMGTAKPLRARRDFIEVFKADKSKRFPMYEVLLVQSGRTKDGRFIERGALEDAVARRLFDGAKCFWSHPTAEGQRPGVPCGFVKPGSVKQQENKANGIDVIGLIGLIPTDAGKEIEAVLDASLDTGVPLVGNSIYAKRVWMREGAVDGRPCEIVTRFEKIDAVDFVNEPAYPRAGVISKLAAEARHGGAAVTKVSIMDQVKLEGLETRIGDLEKKLAAATTESATFAAENKRMQAEKDVDALLSASGLPQDIVVVSRPILLAIDDADLRKAQLEFSKRAFWVNAKPGGGTAGPNDDKPKAVALRADVDAAAKRLGLTGEQLAAAAQK